VPSAKYPAANPNRKKRAQNIANKFRFGASIGKKSSKGKEGKRAS
jgi:hypothetical protein